MATTVRTLCAALTFALLGMAPAWAETTATLGATLGVTPGKLVLDAPTLTAIGVEWKIAGDDNRNAGVGVSYRRKGEQAWRKALPLLRIHHEVINSAEPPFRPTEPSAAIPNGTRENPWHYDTGNMFAGSILNLEPDTEYECRYVLSDPDGGGKEQVITVRTRKEPQAAPGGRIFHVYPIGWT